MVKHERVLSQVSPVNGRVRFVMRRKLVSLSSSVRVILFFFFAGSSLLMAVGIFGPATSGSDSMLFVSPRNMFRFYFRLQINGVTFFTFIERIRIIHKRSNVRYNILETITGDRDGVVSRLTGTPSSLSLWD